MKTLKFNKKVKANFVLWILCFVAGNISYYIVALVINTMVGDLYVNNIGLSILELSAQFFSGFLVYK